MARAYGWAAGDPVRRLRYGVVTTAVSVVAALGVGLVEVAGVLPAGSALGSGPGVPAAAVVDRIRAVPLERAGWGIVGVLVLVWGVALTRTVTRTVAR